MPLLDVNSNANLTGSLAAEINQYRKELRQKDELIRDLGGTTTAAPPQQPSANVTAQVAFPDTRPKYYNHFYTEQMPYGQQHAFYGQNPNMTGPQFVAPPGYRYQMVPDQTVPQLHQVNIGKPVQRETIIKESVALDGENDELNRTKTELDATRRLLEREYEDRRVLHPRTSEQQPELEILNAKSKILIERLQNENNQKSDRIIDLDGRVKTLLEERESHQSADISTRNILSDALIRTAGALCLATPGLPDDDVEEYRTKCKEVVDELVTAANEQNRELILAKASLSQAEAELAKRDETKDSHNGTVQQLCEELAETKKNLADQELAIKTVTADKDAAEMQIEVKDKEIEVLRERLDNQISLYDTLKGDQDAGKATTAEKDAEMRKLAYEKRIAETELRTTLESLATSLADPDDSDFKYDPEMGISAIKQEIMKTIAANREKSSAVKLLEEKCTQLTDQLEKQCELHAETLKRARESEHDKENEKFRIQALETELASQDVLRDTYQQNKEKYIHFLNQVSNIIGCTELGTALGLDLSTMDVILERIKQLACSEGEELANKSSSNHILNRKLKELKKQLADKDMHLDLLRKKLIKLDEQNITRENLYIDRDDAVKNAKKMEKRIYRLENELGNERCEGDRLKAELSETRALQLRVCELERELDEKCSKLARLENKSGKQSAKLKSLKHNLTMTEADSQDIGRKLKEDLKSTKYDLKQLRTSFDEINRQKKSLTNFRSVIAKMLGLDVNALSVPDFEVINRLEKLIQTHHVQQASSIPCRPIAPAVIPPTQPTPVMGTFQANMNIAPQQGQSAMGYSSRPQSEYVPVRSRRYSPSRVTTRLADTEKSSEVPLYDNNDASTRLRSRRYRSASPSRKHRVRY